MDPLLRLVFSFLSSEYDETLSWVLVTRNPDDRFTTLSDMMQDCSAVQANDDHRELVAALRATSSTTSISSSPTDGSNTTCFQYVNGPMQRNGCDCGVFVVAHCGFTGMHRIAALLL